MSKPALKIKNYRSSIPQGAKERVTARHIQSRRRFKAEYRLNGNLVGIRFFDERGQIEIENPVKEGRIHGTRYFFHSASQLHFAEPYVNGLAHGVARQWSEDGESLGTYTMRHGTGVDLWRNSKNWGNGLPFLSEARYIKDGKWHGFEWWLDEGQKSVWQERHFQFDELHGIDRSWNSNGRLRRGYPKYWLNGIKVTKRKYMRACSTDKTLPVFRQSDDKPQRHFPSEIALNLN